MVFNYVKNILNNLNIRYSYYVIKYKYAVSKNMFYDNNFIERRIGVFIIKYNILNLLLAI